MSQVFADYAADYDRLYGDKDYERECDFVLELARGHARRPVHSILDLGCGTGGHAIPLARRGYGVTGVDLSPDMLAAARTKAQREQMELALREGNIQDVRLGRRFDLVLSMFAVIGYQTTNEELERALATAHEHLDDGGVFIFDVWSGPAVLIERPVERIKELGQDGTQLIRIARPTLELASQTVEVNYHVLELRDRQILREVRESHRMRFFFPQELALLVERAGLEFVAVCPFLEPNVSLRESDWNVTVIARRT